MKNLGLFGVTVILLAIAAMHCTGVDARRRRPSRRSRPTRGSRPQNPHVGEIKMTQGESIFGSKDKQHLSFLSRTKCQATTEVGTWSRSASKFVHALKEAITEGCNDDIPMAVKKMQDEASAYARVAIEAFASCENTGSGTGGCAYAEASADAQAQAMYDGFAEAFADAASEEGECACALNTFASTYNSVERWGKLYAGAWAVLKVGACQEGEGKSTIEQKVTCFANSVAKITAKAAAGAWYNGECTDDGKVQDCITKKCTGKKDTPKCHTKCEADHNLAKARTRAVLDVDETIMQKCDVDPIQIVGDVTEEKSAATGHYEENDFHGISKCVATAEASRIAKSASAYVEAVNEALLESCTNGVDKPAVDKDRAVAYTFADAYAHSLVRCDVSDNDEEEDAGVGCAIAESFAIAFAQATADVLAEAGAEGSVPLHCGCQSEAVSYTDMLEAFHSADLFSKAVSMVGVDLWGDDEEKCITSGNVKLSTSLNCVASSMATLVAKAKAEALIKGKCRVADASECDTCIGKEDDEEKCEAEKENCQKDNKFYTSAYAEALAKADVELQPGFCEVNNIGGYFSYDGTSGEYKCIDGC